MSVCTKFSAMKRVRQSHQEIPAICTAILEKIICSNHDKAVYFMDPVDLRFFFVFLLFFFLSFVLTSELLRFIPSYALIVTRAMDLGTIRKKLKDQPGYGGELFAKDVRQTFANAMLFNGAGEPVYEAASVLLEQFEKEWAKFGDAPEEKEWKKRSSKLVARGASGTKLVIKLRRPTNDTSAKEEAAGVFRSHSDGIADFKEYLLVGSVSLKEASAKTLRQWGRVKPSYPVAALLDEAQDIVCAIEDSEGGLQMCQKWLASELVAIAKKKEIAGRYTLHYVAAVMAEQCAFLGDVVQLLLDEPELAQEETLWETVLAHVAEQAGTGRLLGVLKLLVLKSPARFAQFLAELHRVQDERVWQALDLFAKFLLIDLKPPRPDLLAATCAAGFPALNHAVGRLVTDSVISSSKASLKSLENIIQQVYVPVVAPSAESKASASPSLVTGLLVKQDQDKALAVTVLLLKQFQDSAEIIAALLVECAEAAKLVSGYEKLVQVLVAKLIAIRHPEAMQRILERLFVVPCSKRQATFGNVVAESFLKQSSSTLSALLVLAWIPNVISEELLGEAVGLVVESQLKSIDEATVLEALFSLKFSPTTEFKWRERLLDSLVGYSDRTKQENEKLDRFDRLRLTK
jgi:hypothetical protein